MFIITLPLEGMKWGDLRRFVELNHAADGSEPVGIYFTEDGDVLGLTEQIPSAEVRPRGE